MGKANGTAADPGCGATRWSLFWVGHLEKIEAEGIAAKDHAAREGLSIHALYQAKTRLLAQGAVPRARGSAAPTRWALRLRLPAGALLVARGDAAPHDLLRRDAVDALGVRAPELRMAGGREPRSGPGRGTFRQVRRGRTPYADQPDDIFSSLRGDRYRRVRCRYIDLIQTDPGEVQRMQSTVRQA